MLWLFHSKHCCGSGIPHWLTRAPTTATTRRNWTRSAHDVRRQLELFEQVLDARQALVLDLRVERLDRGALAEVLPIPALGRCRVAAGGRGLWRRRACSRLSAA